MQERTRPIRVVIVDDHEVVRQGVRLVLESAGGIEVCGEASTAPEAVRAAERLQPDVVVMDVRLADGSGIDATREIRARRPATQVLMLTSFADDEALFSSIMAGAAGYVLKQVKGGDLVRDIRAVAGGQSLLDPAVTGAVLDRIREGAKLLKDSKLACLSPQEERILTLVAQGRTNREIAQEIGGDERAAREAVACLVARLHRVRRATATTVLQSMERVYGP